MTTPTANQLRTRLYHLWDVQAALDAELHAIYGDGFKNAGRMSAEDSVRLADASRAASAAERECIAAGIEY